uniref:C-type lectin domain-containing protein n=1 Tax=Scleropages formosus TaxID=113540 RepID=A0A8C9W8T9_SCLFO
CKFDWSLKSYPFICIHLVRSFLRMCHLGKWTDALQHCESAGGQLVSISSPDVQATVSQALGGSARSGNAWIGLRQSVCTGRWYWLSEESLAFTRWAAGEPSLRYENKCAGVSLEPQRNFTWSAENCCAARPFVCYFYTQY